MFILNINKYHFIKGGAERFYFELAKLLDQKGRKVIPFAMQHPNNQSSKYEKYFVSNIQTEKIKFDWQGLRTVSRYFWSFEARRKLKQLIKNQDFCVCSRNRPLLSSRRKSGSRMQYLKHLHLDSRWSLPRALMRGGNDKVDRHKNPKNQKTELAILHNIYHQISPSILPVFKKHGIKTILIAHDYGLLSPNYNMFVRGKIYDKICGKGFLKCIPDKCIKNSFLASLVCGLETWFHHSVLNIYKKNIDIVICPSKFMYTKFVQASWPKEKLVHLPYFTEALEHWSTGAQKQSDKNYILYFGRLSEEKGVGVLINAMRDLPDVKLKIVGAGPEKENYELRIMNYGLKNTELLGYKSGSELQELVFCAKFIVVPSIWYENYPLSILEAYALGVPSLVSDIGGLPEMIPDDNENFLFKPGDIQDLKNKIKFLWNNKHILDMESEKVKEFVKENNSPEEYYRKLMDIFSLLS